MSDVTDDRTSEAASRPGVVGTGAAGIDDPQVTADEGTAPVLAGDDVRPGPELTDEPRAGGVEPTD